MADSLLDIEVGKDRDIVLDEGHDAAVVTGQDNIEQSVYLDVANVVRELIGETITPSAVNDAAAAVGQVLDDDPQIDSVITVKVDKIDKGNGEVSFKVRTIPDDEFTIDVEV